jgi:16S rRNA (guanine527-N7)-methyltransferase
MDRQEYLHYIIDAFSQNGLGHLVDETKADKLFSLSNLLVSVNKTTNLTAITDEKDIILKHFVDCATVCDFLRGGDRVIDVGCGAGFPSLPIAILRDDVLVTSIDSTGKKVAFVQRVADELGIGNLNTNCCRAEDYAKENRESFDVCVSRAVARLNILSELCLPFVKVGGNFLSMKSEKGSEEFAEAKRGIEALGGKLSAKKEMTLSLECVDINRELYLIAKTSPTPTAYPRNYSQITKKPL